VPLFAALVLALAVALFFPVLVPLSLVLRYRAGTARRRARGWVATLNVTGLSFSLAFFLAAAALTSLWVPHAFTYSLYGLAGGAVLGVAGLRLSRWEPAPEALHYTPNRWLVLTLTLVVSARMVYGLARAVHAWRATPGDQSWLAASGAAGSLAAGAVVLGYYVTYAAGVWRRFRRHARG
jgi:hypothetical protein